MFIKNNAPVLVDTIVDATKVQLQPNEQKEFPNKIGEQLLQIYGFLVQVDAAPVETPKLEEIKLPDENISEEAPIVDPELPNESLSEDNPEQIENPLACDQCEFVAKNKNGLRLHKLKHS